MITKRYLVSITLALGLLALMTPATTLTKTINVVDYRYNYLDPSASVMEKIKDADDYKRIGELKQYLANEYGVGIADVVIYNAYQDEFDDNDIISWAGIQVKIGKKQNLPAMPRQN